MAQPKNFCMLGISFHTASMDTRAACALGQEDGQRLLRALKAQAPGLEALVLSTCNRTEIYFASVYPLHAEALADDALRSIRPKAASAEGRAWAYRHEHGDAAAHLFKVAAGLDSAILGDLQILGQLKRAFADAVNARTAGHYMHRTVGAALRCGKRARRETGIASGASGIGSALVSVLARKLKPSNAAPEILVLGAGKVACDAGRQIVRRLSGKPCFLSRSLERAAEAAKACGGTAASWSELPRLLPHADAVIAATSAPHAVLPSDLLEAACRQRGRALLVLDAGLPRNVEPGSTADVFDLDYIRRHQDESLALREAAVPAATRIVEEESLRWRRWSASLRVEPIIRHLYEHAEQQSAKHANAVAFWLRCSPDKAERLVLKHHRRSLHAHVLQLRERAQSATLTKDSLLRFAPGFH